MNLRPSLSEQLRVCGNECLCLFHIAVRNPSHDLDDLASREIDLDHCARLRDMLFCQVVGQNTSLFSISRKHSAAVSPRSTVNHRPVWRK